MWIRLNYSVCYFSVSIRWRCLVVTETYPMIERAQLSPQNWESVQQQQKKRSASKHCLYKLKSVQMKRRESVLDARCKTGIENDIIYCGLRCQLRWSARQEKRQTVLWLCPSFSLKETQIHTYTHTHKGCVPGCVSPDLWLATGRWTHGTVI